MNDIQRFAFTSSSADHQLAMLVAGVRDFAIYMLTPEGHVSSWNAGAERFKGFRADEIIGRHFSRFYTPEDQADGLPERALLIARTEGKFEAEGWRVRKDGSRFWAHVVIDALYGDEGQLIGYAKITRDVTERREAERAALQAKEEALRARTEEYLGLLRLFEQAPGFVCFLRGAQHIYELQNEAHRRLANYRDIIGKPVREALPELEDQGFFELLDRVFLSGTPYVGQAIPLRVNPPGGGEPEQRYIDFVYQPIFDGAGHVTGIFSQGNDVTEQIMAQQALRRQQEELQNLLAQRTHALEHAQRALNLARRLQGDKMHLLQLFDQAPGFICVLNGPDHTFELANQSYRALVGHRDLIGLPVREALPELVGQGFSDLLDRVYASGEPYIGRGVPVLIQQSRHSEPVQRYLDFVYQPVIVPGGEVVGIFVQGHDVTEQRLVQDELKRYQEQLEMLVMERTQELADTQTALQRSQKLEAIGKLTGGVAHDFNNILQVVSGNLQLLQREIGDTTFAGRFLDAALAAVERGAKISSQLLAFARRQPLQPAVINPGNVPRSMEDFIARVAGETIRVEIVKPAGLWNTLVDPHQLENVLLNLVINARDAMPGGGTLTIEIANSMLDDDYAASEPDHVQPGQYVMFAVSDTGTGMTREVLEKACDPFFTTKPEGEGTGLGLSMAYGFVKQSGGHFKIYSEVGHGTTVRLYFPRSHEDEIALPASASGPLRGGTETILVAEDDLTVQNTVVDMLGSLGYRILRANDAESALEILHSGEPIDLLFTDVVMPGRIRSPELARQAKLLHPDIEVLFTSGYTQDAIVHGGRLDPGVQLLSKPYRREDLARKVRHLLDHRQQAMQTPEEPIAHSNDRRRILVVEDNHDAREILCELLARLGYDADGAVDAESALQVLDRTRYDILFTDIHLPGIDGVELAGRAFTARPALRIILASGDGPELHHAVDFPHVVLGKPFQLHELTAALRRVEAA